MEKSVKARVIVIGNAKGGSGKSTTAMHLAVALMGLGHAVATIDLDPRQGTLTRYIENRRALARRLDLDLPVPGHVGPGQGGARDEEDCLDALIARLGPAKDAIVIDTPGSDSALSRMGHTWADTLVTPLNDSFLDLDVLARVDGETLRIVGPSQYAKMIWEQRKKRARMGLPAIDWIVMRNRLSNLHARNKHDMADILDELSGRIGFRLAPGFGERVIFRELFLKGLTVMDPGGMAGGPPLTLSHVAARQEVRALVAALNVPLLNVPPPGVPPLETVPAKE
ncbi:MAG: division plane positioning ATPase MipZ [Rhodospirillales bacterium]|jgi:chromosome partitioning protein|nr:division plane positioning ATPase MipZ [Rhodospirillales bacterium]